jgi:hypothetical protein
MYEFGTGKSRLSMIIKTKVEFDFISVHTSTLRPGSELSVIGLTNIPIHIRKNTQHFIIPRVENPKQPLYNLRDRDVGFCSEIVGVHDFPDYFITVDVK